MENLDDQCKHNRISRNCYLCHLEFAYPQDKSDMDALHETISELKIRTAKLEEYKRLQDDENKTNNRLLATFNEDIKKLDEHRKKQIDENRAVSKHLDQLDKLCDVMHDFEKDIHDHHAKQIYINHDIFKRLDELDRQLKYQGDINVVLLDKFKECIKKEIIETMLSSPIKTTGLSFEEAIVAFKAGKKIRFHDGMSESTTYEPKSSWCFGFDYEKIKRDHWEIVE